MKKSLPRSFTTTNLAGRLKISTSCIGVYIIKVGYQLTNKFENKIFYMILLTIIYLCIILIFHEGTITRIVAKILNFLCFLTIYERSIKFSFIIHTIYCWTFFPRSFRIIKCIKIIIMSWISIMNKWSFQNIFSL